VYFKELETKLLVNTVKEFPLSVDFNTS